MRGRPKGQGARQQTGDRNMASRAGHEPETLQRTHYLSGEPAFAGQRSGDLTNDAADTQRPAEPYAILTSSPIDGRTVTEIVDKFSPPYHLPPFHSAPAPFLVGETWS
jgi:hypothetical protein